MTITVTNLKNNITRLRFKEHQGTFSINLTQHQALGLIDKMISKTANKTEREYQNDKNARALRSRAMAK